ncbi:MAG: AAA family ATPase [Candidatus Aenigmatarchaeota archaeon]
MITKIKLRNWRSHDKSEFSFCEGTNALVGIMGSGKSSVMAALCFALFGTFPELQSRKIRLEDIMMKKPVPKQDAEVEVHFSVGNDEYRVTRKISKTKSTSAELRKNNTVVESPQPSKVTAEIENLLKMNYDLFTRAIYSEQNAIDMFLTIPKGQRMKKIDELLAIHKFEKARATTTSLVNRCRFAASEKQKLLAGMQQEAVLKEIESIKKELQGLAAEKESAEKKLDSMVNKKKYISRTLEDQKKNREELMRIENEISTSTALLKEIRKDIDEFQLDAIEYAEKTESEIMQVIRSMEREKDVLSHDLEAEKKKHEGMIKIIALKDAKVKLLKEERIPELKKLVSEKKKLEQIMGGRGIEKLRKKMEEAKKLTEKENEIMLQHIAAIGEIEKSIKELSASGATCPVCDQKLTEKKKKTIVKSKKDRIRKLKSEATKLKDRIGKMKTGIGKLEKELRKIESLEQKASDLVDADSQLSFAKAAQKKLEEEVASQETEEKMLNKTISISQKKFDELKEKMDKIKQHLSVRQQIQSKTKASKELQQKISDLMFKKQQMPAVSELSIAQLESEFKSVIAAESTLRARVENISSLSSEKSKRMEELESKNKMVDGYRAEIRKLDVLAAQLRLLESSLTATQEQLRKNFVSAVNQAMQIIWESTYPYKDFYSCRLGITEGDYMLQLQDSTGWVPVDGIASGGERSIACLTLRIAFSLVLAPQLSWLVLDEPTHNLDSRAVEDLGNVLREKITDLVEQVFLITHDPLLESAVSGYLYRLERQKEKDAATSVIMVAGPED